MAKFRILIVDDEEDIRTIQRLALGAKYEVVEAHDGLDALEKLEEAEPDFVILDVMMPLMDGYQACRAIRNHEKFRGIPVLFLSARREKESIQEGYSAGANLYLTKPFEPDRLVKNVERFFEERGARPRPKRLAIEQIGRAPAAAKPEVVAAPVQAPPPVEARPRVEAPPAAPQPAAVPEAPEPQFVAARPRVMVVDDNVDLLQLLAVALGGDFEVTTAQDGIDGVEKIILYQPDLIVLDAMLPKMSGYQMCMSLRRNRRYQQTPIIFISAKSSARDQEYCRRLGANEFIAKPFDPEYLKRRLISYTTAAQFRIAPKKITWEQLLAREKTHLEWSTDREERAEKRRRASELQDHIDHEMR